MFSKKIINSARFLKMPIDTQGLYFHLALNADDDGIVEAWSIMKMIGTSEDNIRVLSAKGLVRILNEDLVSYITDWGEHNVIRADRKIDSIYKNLLLQIVPDAEVLEPKPRSDVEDNSKRIQGILVDRSQLSNGQSTDGLGKDRLGKEKILNTADATRRDYIAEIIYLFKEIDPTYEEWYGNKTQRGAVKWLIDKFGFEEVSNMVSALPAINAKEFVIKSTTPWELKKNLGKLKAHFDQSKSTQKNKLTIAI